MGYLGTPAAVGFSKTTKDRFSGDNSTTGFTMSQAASTATDIQVFVDNIRQEPTIAYSVSGATLTFTEAPPTGTNNVYVIHQHQALGTGPLPPQDLGSTDYIFGDDISFNSDASVINMGLDSEIKITHVHNTGILLTDSGGTPTLQFHDANESVSSDGSKLILTSNGVAFSLPTADGTSGQALTTNASGVLSFATVSLTGIDDQSSSNDDQLTIKDGEVIINEDSDDVDFRVEGDGNTHLFHTDAGSDRVGINTGATNLGAGNYGVLNVGGVVANAGQHAIFATGSKTSYVSASYRLWLNGFGIGDSTAQAQGVGGAIVFTGKTTDGDDTQVHAGTIEMYKVSATSTEYGFKMIFRTRENGNATMQTAAVFDPDAIELYTGNTHRFNIANNGDITATDTSIGSLSDERLKENIKDHTYPLDTFKKFSVKSFDWKQPTEHGDRSNQKGLIAQEVEKVDDSFVYEYQLVDTSKDREYVPTTQITKKIVDDFTKVESTEIRDVKLAKASKLNQKDAMYISVIQQLMTKIETLESEVAKLKG